MTEIIFATGNKDKMREIREIMADCDVHIVSMKEAGIRVDIVEDELLSRKMQRSKHGRWLHIRMRLFWLMIPDWKSMH